MSQSRKILENPRKSRKMLVNQEKCYKILKNDTKSRKMLENLENIIMLQNLGNARKS